MVHYLLIWIDIIWIRLDWMRSDQIRCMAGGPLQFGLVPHYVADSNRGLPTSEAFSAPWYYLGTWTIRCYQETSFDTPFAELESFRDLAWPVRSRAKRFSPCGAMFGRTERSYHFSSVAELFWTQSHGTYMQSLLLGQVLLQVRRTQTAWVRDTGHIVTDPLHSGLLANVHYPLPILCLFCQETKTHSRQFSAIEGKQTYPHRLAVS